MGIEKEVIDNLQKTDKIIFRIATFEPTFSSSVMVIE